MLYSVNFLAPTDSVVVNMRETPKARMPDGAPYNNNKARWCSVFFPNCSTQAYHPTSVQSTEYLDGHDICDKYSVDMA